MEDQAAPYRKIAAQVRAMAGTLSDEQARQDMLRIALVWDKLAAFAEKAPPTDRASSLPASLLASPAGSGFNNDRAADTDRSSQSD